MTIQRAGLGGWWGDLRAAGDSLLDVLLPASWTGARDVVYQDVSDLTIRDPATLTAAERARLAFVVEAGRRREAMRAARSGLVAGALLVGVVGLGAWLVSRAIGGRK